MVDTKYYIYRICTDGRQDILQIRNIHGWLAENIIDFFSDELPELDKDSDISLGKQR